MQTLMLRPREILTTCSNILGRKTKHRSQWTLEPDKIWIWCILRWSKISNLNRWTTKMTWMSDLKLCNRLLCSSNLLSTRIYGRLCRRAPPKQMLRLMTFQMSKVHRRTRMKRMCHHRLNMFSLNPRSSKKRLGSDLLHTTSLTNNLFRASCPQTWRQWTLTFKSIQQISRITLKTSSAWWAKKEVRI